MWLTKNEKRVLKLLIENGKLSDTSISNKLNISSQAIGRIRKKLEEEIIKGYTLELDLAKLGLRVMDLIEIKMNPNKLCEEEIEKKLKSLPQFISIFKLPLGTKNYKIIQITSDLEESERVLSDKNLFHNGENIFVIERINRIPLSNIKHQDLRPLLQKSIDDLGTKPQKMKWNQTKQRF